MHFVEMTRASGLPMSLARMATGRRSSVTNFLASSLISMTLLSRAKRGASGNEATNRDTKPNWMTRREKRRTNVTSLDVTDVHLMTHSLVFSVNVALHRLQYERSSAISQNLNYLWSSQDFSRFSAMF